jgi:hypothetical protein
MIYDYINMTNCRRPGRRAPGTGEPVVKKRAWSLALVAAAVLAVPNLAAGPGFDRDTFRQFVQ